MSKRMTSSMNVTNATWPNSTSAGTTQAATQALTTPNSTANATAPHTPVYKSMPMGMIIGLGIGIPIIVIILVLLVVLILLRRYRGTDEGSTKRHWLSVKPSHKHSMESQNAYKDLVVEGTLPARPPVAPRDLEAGGIDNTGFANGASASAKKPLETISDNPEEEVQENYLALDTNLKADNPDEVQENYLALETNLKADNLDDEVQENYLAMLPESPEKENPLPGDHDQPTGYVNLQAPSSPESDSEMYDYAAPTEMLRLPMRATKSDVPPMGDTDVEHPRENKTHSLPSGQSYPEPNTEDMYENTRQMAQSLEIQPDNDRDNNEPDESPQEDYNNIEVWREHQGGTGSGAEDDPLEDYGNADVWKKHISEGSGAHDNLQ